MLRKIHRAIKNVKVRRATPLHIEFNLTDYCNLNCKGCSHYSPLASSEFMNLDSLGKSMRHISTIKNLDLIQEIYLIGGETLLYPKLNEAMEMARKYFPDKKISIFTNGLLIPKMKEDFWEVCRETECVIAITRYPVKFDYDNVERLCKEKGVKCEVFGDRSKDDPFFKLPLDPRKKQKGWVSHFRCISFGCITIDNGKIFPCPQSACVGHLNSRFNTDFRWEKGDYIPVESLRDARELLKFRNNPVPFCKYCKHQYPVEYGPSGRQLEEWT